MNILYACVYVREKKGKKKKKLSFIHPLKKKVGGGDLPKYDIMEKSHQRDAKFCFYLYFSLQLVLFSNEYFSCLFIFQEYQVDFIIFHL